MMDRGLAEGSAESRRRFVTRGGEGERELDLVHSGHQLGRSRHPLPCGSGAGFTNRRRLCQLTAAILISDLTTHNMWVL